ncbi:hypothetical protein AAOE16_00130 [Ekhidna sp. MALMAid0563]|uniref:hypothetical protein n=1 Tax=Ekhidna sp. MALMAid0563 TaxID=3143937 RepID=UPI0032DF41A6
MTKKHQFETEHFRFSDEELQLLRSRFPYRTIAFEEINRISLTKGVRVKRPILVLAFGLTLTISSLYVMLFTSGFLDALLNDNSQGDSFQAYKAFGQFFIMGGFLLAMGGVAIYQALAPTWVMRLELTDGSTDVMSLTKLFETNEVFKLARFLRTNFSTDKILIDNRIG